MKKDLIIKLRSVNAYLATSGSKAELIVIGGAALILNNKVNRGTEDIDSFQKEGNKFISLDEGVMFVLVSKENINSHAENAIII